MIGIFDSGLGGLSAYCELRLRRPDLDILYYADTAHIPYGTRPPSAVLAYAHDSLSQMVELGARAILVACGTVSSVALPLLQKELPVPLYGVIAPTARLAYYVSRNKEIGILATAATITSKAFEDSLKTCGRVSTYAVACPLMVSLVEEGILSPTDPLARMVVKRYLTPLFNAPIDTLILGCTHFSHLAPHISALLPRVTLIGAGEAAAADLTASCPQVGRGNTRFYVTHRPRAFQRAAEGILGMPLPCSAQQI